MNTAIRFITAITLAAALPLIVQAEEKQNPADKTLESGAERSITALIPPTPSDPDIAQAFSFLCGSFKAPAAGANPALWFHASPVRVQGHENTLYFEVSRDDSPAEPIQQGIIQFLKTHNQFRMRMHEFIGSAKGMFVGLWIKPEMMPEIDPQKSLRPLMDIILKQTRAGFEGETACNYPISRDGAIEARSRITFSDQGLRFEDEGFDAAGAHVWGMWGNQTPTFVKADSLITARTLETGVVVITLTPGLPKEEQVNPGTRQPDGVIREQGGQLAVHYSGWLLDGTLFDSSRKPGREPLLMRLPAQVIPGWNAGVAGMRKGERRRLIIPSDQGYGERGRAPIIPPNSTLIFDVECLYVDNTPNQTDTPLPVGGH